MDSVYEDIAFSDSYGRIFSAIPDGSYLFIKNGKEELRGEAYRISEGKMSQIAQTNDVVVLPYDENWKQDFIDIKTELSQALGEIAISIEHVGSTSVEGLAAKPIIDIDVVVTKERINDAILALKSIGYIHEGNLGISGREAFAYKGKEHLQQHHLYVCPQDSLELKRHLAFRDYLRTHPEAVNEYSKVKVEAAKLYPEDIDKYIEYKAPVIENIYSRM